MTARFTSVTAANAVNIGFSHKFTMTSSDEWTTAVTSVLYRTRFHKYFTIHTDAATHPQYFLISPQIL